ncbi:MAG: transcription termination/antitermination protein NusG [Oscillospiraceae bacterium]|jgi:transcriptional antiterminator NusG|nr:transcription termination/antitermination protein NusG [Oscillospiraceae bacterium]
MAEQDVMWYVVHTYSGYENAVATTVVKAAENRGMMRTDENPNPTNELIYEVKIPLETVTEMVDGKEKTSERKVFPGYVLIRMTLTDESWHLVRNVRGVTGFVGSQNKAIPLTEDEMRAMGIERAVVVVGYDIGSTVKITDGPFEGFLGTVDSIDTAAERARVIVSMFGRETPVDLDFRQIAAA